MDVHHHLPDLPAPKSLGGLGDKLPDLGEFIIPDSQGIFQTLHNPIFTQRFFISILKFTLIFTHNFAILIDKRRWRLCQ